MCPPIGEPFLRQLEFMLPNGLLSRGGPMREAEGLLADCGRRSCGGDSMKHSSRVIEVEVDSLLLPAPNRKGGSWLSGLRAGNVFVE